MRSLPVSLFAAGLTIVSFACSTTPEPDPRQQSSLGAVAMAGRGGPAPSSGASAALGPGPVGTPGPAGGTGAPGPAATPGAASPVSADAPIPGASMAGAGPAAGAGTPGSPRAEAPAQASGRGSMGPRDASGGQAGDRDSMSPGDASDESAQGPAEEAEEVDRSAPLTAVAFFPSKGRTDACADASVSIRFNRTPIIKRGGKIQILDETGAVFDSVTARPSDLYFSELSARTTDGKTFKSEVLDVVYDTVVFHPGARLEYGKTYSVTVDEGLITDSEGTPFSISQADNWTFTVRAQAPAPSSSYTLAADGSGEYCSVEGVLRALPDNGAVPRVIHVKGGVYPGIVRMRQSNVHFLGAGIDVSVLAPKNCVTMNASREGFVVSGSDVTFEDLTIFNTYLKDSNGQQAEALRVAESSQRVHLKNVHLRSHQDTLRVDGSAFMEGGKISGSTDPLWGYGAFYCDGCELSSRTSGHAFVVARSRKGFAMVNCSVTRESDTVRNTYLAQYHAGAEPGKIAFVHCSIDSHIRGWRNARNNDWYEYGNTSLETGEPVMFDGRQLRPGSAELDALSSAQSWLGWSP